MVHDALWGSIEIDDWAQGLLADPSVERELLRLKRLKHLGLVSAEFPSAAYTKWEHHLGIYHLSSLADAPAQQRRMLTVLALLEGIGHLPYGYPVERGVLEAAAQSSKVLDDLIQFLTPVRDMLVRYRGSEQKEAERISDMVSRLDYKRVYRWFTARKIMSLPIDVKIGHREKVLYEIVVGRRLRSIYDLLRRIDYLHRDLLYTGLASFRFSKSSLEQLIKGDSRTAWRVLTSLRSYLEDKVYLKPTTIGREHLLTQVIREQLTQGGMTLEDLLKGTDEQLEEALLVRDTSLHRLGSRSFTSVAAELISPELASRDGTSLAEWTARFRRDAPCDGDSLLLVTKLGWDNSVYLGILTSESPDTQVYRVANALARLEECTANLVSRCDRVPLRFRHHGEDLLRWLLNVDVQADYTKSLIRLALVTRQLPQAQYQKVMQAITKPDGTQHPFVELEFALWQLQDLSSLPRSEFVNCFVEALSHSNLPGRLQEVRADLAKAIAEAKFLGDYQEPDRVELTAYVYELLSSSPHGVKWVLPNVRFNGAGLEFEVDVLTVEILDEMLTIRVVECSKNDGTAKQHQDAKKADALIRLLSNRKGVCVDVVTVGKAPGGLSPDLLLEIMLSESPVLPSLCDLKCRDQSEVQSTDSVSAETDQCSKAILRQSPQDTATPKR